MPTLHVDDDFSIMDALDDNRLTLADRGLIATLLFGRLERHDNYTADVTIKRLAALTGSGEGAVHGAVRRIDAHGYLTRGRPAQGEDGKYLPGHWHLHNPA